MKAFGSLMAQIPTTFFGHKMKSCLHKILTFSRDALIVKSWANTDV